MDAKEKEKENESGQSQIHETPLTKQLTVLERRSQSEIINRKGELNECFSF